MTLELTDREVQILVQALRQSEKVSRIGFARRLARDMGNVPAEELVGRNERAMTVFAESAALRAKLGDNKPVSLD